MLQLRSYQAWFRHDILQALKTCRSVLAVSPTGSGKRYSMVDLCLLATSHGRRVLVATNRRLLVSQMAEECQKHGVHYGVIMADHYEGDAGGPVQIASIQTLQSWYLRPGLGAKHGQGLPEYELLLIDEAHSQPDSYQELRSLRPGSKTIGFTATPVGAEGRSLIPRYFDKMVLGPLNSSLVQLWRDTSGREGLLPTVVYAPSEPNIQGVRIANKQEYNQNQLGRAVQECTVFADVFEHWQRLAADRATVCFVPGIPFGRDLERQFNFILGAGSAHLIEAKTKPNDRLRAFEAVEEGRSRILVSCDVLREGWDCPVVSCAIDLQPNSQLRSYWQKVGRIKRPYEDQRDAIYLDFAGNYWRFPHPNEDPIWPTGEETTQEAIERSRKSSTSSKQCMCPRCGRVTDGRQRPEACAGCGLPLDAKPIRRIRMGPGQLQEVPAFAKAKKEKSEAEKLFIKWQSQLFAALHARWTYGQCARLFEKRTGKQPEYGWPGTYSKDHPGWGRRPADEHDKRSLYMACSQTRENLACDDRLF